jgi:hypothetical protein
MMNSRFKKQADKASVIDLSEITIHFQTSFITAKDEDGNATKYESHYNYLIMDVEVIDFLLLAEGRIPKTTP